MYAEWGDFSLRQADGAVTRGLHIGFQAQSRDGAFVLDPDGNNIEVVNHNR